MTNPGKERHWLRQWVEEYFRVIELVAIVVAFFAFGLESCSRQEERRARAWQLLTTKASGNSGKVWALEYLNKRGLWVDLGLKEHISLRGIDLTPPRLAEYWRGEPNGERKFPKGGCSDRVDLHKVELRVAKMEEASLVCADLHHADLRGAQFRKTDFRGAYLEDAKLQGADLKEADLRKTEEINCAQLKQAKNWQGAYRDEALACGAKIPDPRTKAGDGAP